MLKTKVNVPTVNKYIKENITTFDQFVEEINEFPGQLTKTSAKVFDYLDELPKTSQKKVQHFLTEHFNYLATLETGKTRYCTRCRKKSTVIGEFNENTTPENDNTFIVFYKTRERLISNFFCGKCAHYENKREGYEIY